MMPAGPVAVAVLALALAGADVEEWQEPTPAVELQGLATYYRAGLMAEVARNRGMDLAGYAGGVALMRAGDLGRPVWVRFPDGAWLGPFLAVDCARADHYPGNVARGHVVELARSTWLEQGLPEGPVEVTVRFERPGPKRWFGRR